MGNICNSRVDVNFDNISAFMESFEFSSTNTIFKQYPILDIYNYCKTFNNFINRHCCVSCPHIINPVVQNNFYYFTINSNCDVYNSVCDELQNLVFSPIDVINLANSFNNSQVFSLISNCDKIVIYTYSSIYLSGQFNCGSQSDFNLISNDSNTLSHIFSTLSNSAKKTILCVIFYVIVNNITSYLNKSNLSNINKYINLCVKLDYNHLLKLILFECKLVELCNCLVNIEYTFNINSSISLCITILQKFNSDFRNDHICNFAILDKSTQNENLIHFYNLVLRTLYHFYLCSFVESIKWSIVTTNDVNVVCEVINNLIINGKPIY